MRVLVAGASGHLGAASVEALLARPDVEEVVGLCRRLPGWSRPRLRWQPADLLVAELDGLLRGVDVVVHVAWLFHPMRRRDVTWQNNVGGTERLLEAVGRSDVRALVAASSVGAYSVRGGLDPVDESWPTGGISRVAYSREKSHVERRLEAHAARHPHQRVVRLRPGFVFSDLGAAEQRRIFLGPLVPDALLRPGRLPVLPLPRSLRFQALHVDDLAAAVAAAVTSEAEGPLNLAADPVLDPETLARTMRSRWVPVPESALRGATAAAHAARAVPLAPSVLDLLLRLPVMDTARARRTLSWTPTRSATDALTCFLDPVTDPPDTPPLRRRTTRQDLADALRTRMGARDS